MKSCLYHGHVRHRRFRPVSHEFRYALFQLFLDLEELPEILDPYWLWSSRRPAPAWFRRSDYPGESHQPLDCCVRDEVERQTGRRPLGAIRLLTHLRYWGFVMNPVSFYYCFRPDQTLQAVLAEVTNTPWGERHCYVVDAPVRSETQTVRTRWTRKQFHVSPFLNMDFSYRWRISVPGEHLTIHLQNFVVPSHRTTAMPAAESDCPTSSSTDDQPAFDVTLHMQRQELNSRSLAGALIRFPWMTANVLAGIYWQALKLWWKGVPIVPHPKRRTHNSEVKPPEGSSAAALVPTQHPNPPNETL